MTGTIQMLAWTGVSAACGRTGSLPHSLGCRWEGIQERRKVRVGLKGELVHVPTHSPTSEEPTQPLHCQPRDTPKAAISQVYPLLKSKWLISLRL
jgi:hypothetical protein